MQKSKFSISMLRKFAPVSTQGTCALNPKIDILVSFSLTWWRWLQNLLNRKLLRADCCEVGLVEDVSRIQLVKSFYSNAIDTPFSTHLMCQTSR